MKDTKIQWCHSTINPVAGCLGCELFPTPQQICRLLDRALHVLGILIDSGAMFAVLVHRHFAKIRKPGLGHVNEVTTTNIWHLRELFAKSITARHGKAAGDLALATIQEQLTCYAAKLHLNRAASIVKPDRKVNKGYAPTFEQFATFEGRMAAAARWEDLMGTTDPARPWLDGLPRLIFISDMGDALSSKELLPFLRREAAHISSEMGSRHLWLWLTKRPANMRIFANSMGGFPENLCAMTTVTSAKTLGRVDQLRKVPAACRGLSIEPLWERIAPAKLDLEGIDWVIVGGESGARATARPFHLEWAEGLRDHCRRQGVGFFLKQVGSNPFWKGEPLALADKHGGVWGEWPEEFRVRKFPEQFRNYRSEEIHFNPKLAP